MKIDIIKKTLIDKYPQFGSIIDCIDYVETRNCLDYNGHPTLGTDGNTIYYHPDFLEKLSDSQKLFAFAHEICHIAFNHMERGKDKNQELWNYATDAVINAFLRKDGLELIDGVVNKPWAIRYNAEELYEKLLKKKKKQKKKESNNGKEQESSGESQNDAGHDTHRFWNNKTKKPNDKIIEAVQKELEELGEKKVLKKKGVDLKDVLEKIRNALEKMSSTKQPQQHKEQENIQISLGPGTETEETKVKFEDVGDGYPLINWPLILKRQREIVELDWSYQNASIEDGVMMSHLEETSYKEAYETEIVLDTSSSISDELLRSFLRECKNIFNFSKIKVGCFDVKFYGFKEIKGIKDIDEFEFVGRGGTDFNVAVNAFSESADNKIIFTDADGYAPDKEVDAIWIIFGPKEIHPRGGRVYHIDSEKLINLSKEYYPKVLEKK